MADENDDVPASEVAAQEEDVMPGCPGWMLTFGDTVSLLLTFFVMLLSCSDPAPQKGIGQVLSFNKGGDQYDLSVIDVDKKGANRNAGGKGSGEGAKQGLAQVEKKLSAEMLAISNENSYALNMSSHEAVRYFESENVSPEDVQVDKSGESGAFKVSFNEEMVFTVGSATLTPEGRDHVDKIAQLASQLPNDIVIKGFANDYDHVAFPKYSSNIELALARANTIALILSDIWKVLPERIGIYVGDDTLASSNAGDILNKERTGGRIVIEILGEFQGYAKVIKREYARSIIAS